MELESRKVQTYRDFVANASALAFRAEAFKCFVHSLIALQGGRVEFVDTLLTRVLKGFAHVGNSFYDHLQALPKEPNTPSLRNTS